MWLHLNPALNSCREGLALLELRSSQGKAWSGLCSSLNGILQLGMGDRLLQSQAAGSAVFYPTQHSAQAQGNILPCLWHQSCLKFISPSCESLQRRRFQMKLSPVGCSWHTVQRNKPFSGEIHLTFNKVSKVNQVSQSQQVPIALQCLLRHP